MRNHVRELRTAKGLSQSELGAALDVSRQTINAIELGKYSPSLEVAFRIAATFNAPLEQVFQYRKGAPSKE